jgi:hypothetical protein
MTIQQGDAFVVVCGNKESKGYVRVMGLGPTPQDVGTLGLKCYKPTRLQIEIIARTKVESEKAALEERVLQLQAQIEQRVQQDRASEEPLSHHGSTTLHVCLYIPNFPCPYGIAELLYATFSMSLFKLQK